MSLARRTLLLHATIVAALTAIHITPRVKAAPHASLTVLHAGSLNNLVQRGIGPAFQQTTGISVRNEGGNSGVLANAIRARTKRGNVYMSADVTTTQTLIGAANGNWIRWFVTFAGNAVVIGYNPTGPFAADFERARTGAMPWYDVLRQPGIRLMRNDPNLDPLGYYALFVCQLAEAYSGVPSLARQILGDDNNAKQIGNPGVAMLQRGEVDAIFLYRTGALDSNVPHLILPDEINLGNPAMAARYATAQYTTTQGQTFRGGPIRFSAGPLTLFDATARNPSPDPTEATQFIRYLLSSAGQQLVQTYHFLPAPVLVGGDIRTVPGEIQSFVQGIYRE